MSSFFLSICCIVAFYLFLIFLTNGTPVFKAKAAAERRKWNQKPRRPAVLDRQIMRRHGFLGFGTRNTGRRRNAMRREMVKRRQFFNVKDNLGRFIAAIPRTVVI